MPTTELYDKSAWATLSRPGGLDILLKRAFVPAGDPAMTGGAPPMDPAAGGGAPPMDPAAGGAPPPPPGGPGMPGAPPPGGALPPEIIASIQQTVSQAMQQNAMAGGGGAGAGGKGGGGMKVTPEMQYAQGGRMMAVLISIAKTIGAEIPPEALNDASMIQLATAPSAPTGAAGMLGGAPPAGDPMAAAGGAPPMDPAAGGMPKAGAATLLLKKR